MPTQICRLIQVALSVPVQHILWGHPNLRDPHGRGKQWAKEHRIRIYAQDFLPIGFHFPFKQKILEDMAKRNLAQKFSASKPCNPLGKHKPRKKDKHKDEEAKGLPALLKGKHFDAYFQICRAMGCTQGKESDRLVVISEE